MTAADLSDAQRQAFARLKAAEFSYFLERIADDTNDSQIVRYLYALFFKIYEMNVDKKYVTKSQACRFIPLRHASSCQKYMDEAEKQGYLEFERDRKDKRKIIVKPSAMLIDFIDSEIDKTFMATMRPIRRRSPSTRTSAAPHR